MDGTAFGNGLCLVAVKTNDEIMTRRLVIVKQVIQKTREVSSVHALNFEWNSTSVFLKKMPAYGVIGHLAGRKSKLIRPILPCNT